MLARLQSVCLSNSSPQCTGIFRSVCWCNFALSLLSSHFAGSNPAVYSKGICQRFGFCPSGHRHCTKVRFCAGKYLIKDWLSSSKSVPCLKTDTVFSKASPNFPWYCGITQDFSRRFCKNGNANKSWGSSMRFLFRSKKNMLTEKLAKGFPRELKEDVKAVCKTIFQMLRIQQNRSEIH